MFRTVTFGLIVITLALTGCSIIIRDGSVEVQLFPPSETDGLPSGVAPGEPASFFLIIPQDDGVSGTPVGCGDSAIAVASERAATGDLVTDLRASLEALFSIKTATHGQSGLAHSLAESDLFVQSVTVDDGTALIELAGNLQLLGTCADARMEAQIMLTVFQYPGFERALVRVNGVNLLQMFDLSGQSGADAVYTRARFE